MKAYSREEALRRYWYNTIENVVTARNVLKKSLLYLLSTEGQIDAFEQKHKALLSDKHGLDFWWKPRFKALRSFFHWFFRGVHAKGGSELRRALKNHPELPAVKLNCEEVPNLDNDTDFEQALYENPTAAYHWLLEVVNSQGKALNDSFFERLKALTPALSLETLEPLLKGAAERAPKETLTHALAHIKNLTESREYALYGKIIAPLLVKIHGTTPHAAEDMLLIVATGTDIGASLKASVETAKRAARKVLQDCMSEDAFAEKCTRIIRNDAEYISSYTQPAPYENALTLLSELAKYKKLNRTPLLMALALELKQAQVMRDTRALKVINEHILEMKTFSHRAPGTSTFMAMPKGGLWDMVEPGSVLFRVC